MRDKQTPTTGIHVSLPELIAVRNTISKNLLDGKKNKLNFLSGQRLTRIRGRGIEFDSTREYQPGDDIRSMAWRVTARSLKPHIKVYHEERERPVWLAVDLSPSLYFGTRRMFKSVRSIKEAAFLGWSYLAKRERIGAIIGSQKMMVYQPQSDERNFLTILHSLSSASLTLPSYKENNHLYDVLLTLQQQVRSGNLLFILSDFFQFDTKNQKLILHLAQRTQVILHFVYDPFESDAPPPHQYLLTDGQDRVVFNMENKQSREHYQQQFQAKLQELVHFSRLHNIPLQISRTDQERKEWAKL